MERQRKVSDTIYLPDSWELLANHDQNDPGDISGEEQKQFLKMLGNNRFLIEKVKNEVIDRVTLWLGDKDKPDDNNTLITDASERLDVTSNWHTLENPNDPTTFYEIGLSDEDPNSAKLVLTKERSLETKTGDSASIPEVTRMAVFNGSQEDIQAALLGDQNELRYTPIIANRVDGPI
ncbi:MAG TPA: hypothetical protein VNE40_04180 [Candidatus Dormibacteraeota bacterium]|nr:hypothetical protein [Candidatus Dormibacteraeota bacterium]